MITMSSGGMYGARLEVERLEMTKDYRGAEQYARAKRAQVTLNEMWAVRCRDAGVVFHAMHPGGADTLVWLAADDGAPSTSTGRFWLDRRPRSIHKLPTTRRSDSAQRRASLWTWCVERSGVEPSPLLGPRATVQVSNSPDRLSNASQDPGCAADRETPCNSASTSSYSVRASTSR